MASKSTNLKTLSVSLVLKSAAFENACKKSTTALAGLGKSIRGMASPLAGLAAGLASIGTAKWVIGIASQMENLQVQFETMLQSAEKAKDLMGELNAFAQKTPFETAELATATKQLLAYGVAQKDIIPTMTKLGDLSSGLGMDLKELADLYGKAKVQGRLYSVDVMQFMGRGINVVAEFAKMFNVSQGEVKKLVEQGKIGFPELERAITSMTGAGSQFGGGMEKLSKTLAGQWSSLQDSIKLVANDLGTLMLPMLKSIVAESAKFVENMKNRFPLKDEPGTHKKPEIDSKVAEITARIAEIKRDIDKNGDFSMFKTGQLFSLETQLSEWKALKTTADLNARAAVPKQLAETIEKVKAGASTIKDNLIANFNQVGNHLNSVFTNPALWAKPEYNFQKMGENIKNNFTHIAEHLGKVFAPVVGAIPNHFDAVRQEIEGNAKSFIDDLENRVRDFGKSQDTVAIEQMVRDGLPNELIAQARDLQRRLELKEKEANKKSPDFAGLAKFGSSEAIATIQRSRNTGVGTVQNKIEKNTADSARLAQETLEIQKSFATKTIGLFDFSTN